MSGAIHKLPVLPLADGLRRRITYVRISLTDRCNYRCTYCMPEEGVSLLPKVDILSFEELERLARIFSSLGVRRIRLTGGEPTVRKDLVTVVNRLARVPGIDAVVITTNGHLLADLAPALRAAGLAGLNVSVDTLDPEKFRKITRRGDLARVIAGIDAVAGLPLKINTVALRGFNDDEVGALCDFAWERGALPRFIEWMPMSDGALYAPGSVMTASEVRTRVEAHVGGPIVPDSPPSGVVGPARYWRDAAGRKVGIISAISEHFCDTCNRVRLSATGQLHTCLAYDDATDLRRLLREGAADGDIEEAIRLAVGLKRPGHIFTLDGHGAPKKHMVSIGG